VLIPKFNNTEEALVFGAAHTSQAEIRLLRLERARLVEQFKKLFDSGKEKEALFLASGQAQFVREALEEAEIISNKKSTVTSRVLNYSVLFLGFIWDVCLWIIRGIFWLYSCFVLGICAGMGLLAFILASAFAFGVFLMTIILFIHM